MVRVGSDDDAGGFLTVRVKHNGEKKDDRENESNENKAGERFAAGSDSRAVVSETNRRGVGFAGRLWSMQTAGVVDAIFHG